MSNIEPFFFLDPNLCLYGIHYCGECCCNCGDYSHIDYDRTCLGVHCYGTGDEVACISYNQTTGCYTYYYMYKSECGGSNDQTKGLETLVIITVAYVVCVLIFCAFMNHRRKKK